MSGTAPGREPKVAAVTRSADVACRTNSPRSVRGCGAELNTHTDPVASPLALPPHGGTAQHHPIEAVLILGISFSAAMSRLHVHRSVASAAAVGSASES